MPAEIPEVIEIHHIRYGMVEPAERENDDREQHAEGTAQPFFRRVFHRPNGNGDQRAAQNRRAQRADCPVVNVQLRVYQANGLGYDFIRYGGVIDEKGNRAYADDIAEETDRQAERIVLKAHFRHRSDHARKQLHIVRDDGVNTDGKEERADELSPSPVKIVGKQGSGSADPDCRTRADRHQKEDEQLQFCHFFEFFHDKYSQMILPIKNYSPKKEKKQVFRQEFEKIL